MGGPCRWSKRRKINEAFQGTLNSFSIILMVVFLLQVYIPARSRTSHLAIQLSSRCTLSPKTCNVVFALPCLTCSGAAQTVEPPVLPNLFLPVLALRGEAAARAFRSAPPFTPQATVHRSIPVSHEHCASITFTKAPGESDCQAGSGESFAAFSIRFAAFSIAAQRHNPAAVDGGCTTQKG